MRQIADTAQTRQVVLYRHFSSKRELFEHAVLAPLETLLDQIGDISGLFGANVGSSATSVDRSEVDRSEMMRRHLSAVQQITPLLGVAVFGDLDKGSTFYRDQIAPHFDRAGRLIQRYLDQIGKTDLDGRLLYVALFGIHLGLAIDADIRGEILDVPVAAEEVLGLLEKGLIVDPGTAQQRRGVIDIAIEDLPALRQPAPKDRRARMSPEDRRAAIIADAREVYRTKGVARTRMSDIASAAGVTEALVYQYFGSKDELFSEAVLRPSEDMIKRLRNAVVRLLAEADPTSSDATREFHRDILQVILETAPLIGAAVFTGSELGRRAYQEQFYPMLHEAVSALHGHVYRPGRSNVTMIATTTMHFTVAVDAIILGRDIDVSQVSAQLADLVSTGLNGR